MQRWLSFYTIVFLLTSVQTFAQTVVTPQFHEGRLKLVNLIDVYETTENFGNSSSEKTPLDDGNFYKNTSLRSMLYYGFDHHWQISSGLTYAIGKSSTSGEERSKSALTDIHFGVDHRWIEGPFSLYPGLKFDLPLTKVDPNSESLILNEGASSLTASFYFDYKWPILALYGELSPSILGDQRGWRAKYALGVKKRFGRFLVNLELNGWDTLKNDGLTDTPEQRTDVVNRVNGGSLKYYSINPGVTRFAAQARFRLSRSWIAGLGYSTDLKGSRHSSGSSILGYLEFRLPSYLPLPENLTPESYSKRKRPRKRYRKSQDEEDVIVETQIIYVDNIDFQEGFQPNTDESLLKYFDEDPTRPKVKKKKRQRKKKKRKSRRRKKQENVEDWELQ